MLKIKIIKSKNRDTIKFREGGLHQTTHTPMGEKIPTSKVEAALHGKYGKKGAAQARFMKNVLKK